jgi:PhzF family phenazine biosynthesis protein
MTRVRVFQVDAFTHQLFSGNPAGVVLDAQLLDERQMQLIARELNNGDTAFLLPADGSDHDLRVRFFTPRGEVGFVGHATVAAHAVLAAQGLGAHRRQKQRSGIVAIEQLASSRGPRFAFTQPAPPLRGPIDATLRPALLAALGLAAADLDERCPPTLAGEHSTRNLIAVRDGALLARLQPDLVQLAALAAAGAAPGTFVYTLRPAVGECDTEARMFCPALGIPEDPVSGNAHAMLAALLCQLQLLPGGAASSGFRARQGHHMGRAGELQVGVRRADGALSTVSVSGAAVVVFETSIALAQMAA